MDRAVKVACAQVEPVVLDLERTLDRLEEVAADAAGNGAELVVFPETFVPAYPSSRWAKAFAGWQNEGAKQTFARLAQNSVAVGSPAERRIGAAAKELGIWLVTGVNEIESDRPGTIYNSLLYHSPDGELALHHRKLVPTNHERLIWGQGDGRGLHAVDTGFGRIGGLICWENYMPLARVALYESGVELYVASTADDSDAWQATLVHIARESRAYVISPCHFQRASSYPDDFPLASELEGAGIARPRRQRDSRARRLISRGAALRRGRRSSTPTSTRRCCSPSGSASTRSATTAGRTCSSSAFARPMRRRVHVLPRDQTVPDREDVDAVPLELLPVLLEVQRPLADSEVLARVHAARAERHAGIVREDPLDVLAHRVRALGALVGRVVVEDDLGVMQRVDRLEVLPVPRVVVAVDQLGDLARVHA